MKRLIGGLFLLSLLAISLDLSAGETDITDASVLEQLTNLREFIDEQRDFTKESKGLKPVLVQYRSNASKIDGIAQCNLSFNTDALHLSIGGYSVQADGTPITITINVVYEWTEYIGYTIKSAKLNATNEFNALKITGDEIVENMNGYSFNLYEPIENLTLTPVYAGAVKNGNKLTLVFACTLIRTGDVPLSNIYLGRFNVPSDVYAKLYPARVGSYDYLDNKVINSWDSDITFKPVSSFCLKGGDNRVILVANPQPINELTLNVAYYYRYEVTFLLSDNLVPNE